MAEGKPIKNLFVKMDMLGKKTVVIQGLTSKSTVQNLIDKIKDKEGAEDVRLIYCGKPLIPKVTLDEYQIRDESTVFAALRLLGGSDKEGAVNNPALVPDQGDEKNPWNFDLLKKYGIEPTTSHCHVYCGENCGKETVRKAKFPIDNNKFYIVCAECAWDELRTSVIVQGHAQLSIGGTGSTYEPPNPDILLHIIPENEQKEFEIKLASNTYISMSIKVCPNEQCRTFVFNDLKTFRVRCPMCKNDEFCWVCEKKWISNDKLSCGNQDCVPLLFIQNELDNSPKKSMNGHDLKVPKYRLCPNPNCLRRNDHLENCKHMTCGCGHNYCQACLRKWANDCKCDFCKRPENKDKPTCSLAQSRCPIHPPQQLDMEKLALSYS
jgi:hypothetical protein